MALSLVRLECGAHSLQHQATTTTTRVDPERLEFRVLV